VLLLVLCLPLALISAWIRLDSPGPAFFRQVRVGRRGQEFRIFKFRTMSSQAPRPGPQLTIGTDARITSAGAFLRHYKLDELPQLINVLKGEMSLVGPRPEVPRYVAHYPPDVRQTVLSVRPGITDLASIEFKRESDLLGQSIDPEKTYLEEILPIKLRYYVDYVRNRSLSLDFKILFKTLTAVFINK
jgi:lipopolysaccharide/colanic/teichoic acid biosynthesis glycosyltransferase